MAQIDPQTGMEIPQQFNAPIPANMQGGRQQSFITPQQQQVGQGLFSNDQQQASPLLQKKNALGNTKEEQAELNTSEKNKQQKNPKEYSDFMKARALKKEWEKTDNESGFGTKEYPKQAALDSLRSVYKHKKTI